MKLSKLLTLSVFTALALAPVRAQNNGWVRVQVPFSFVAGGRTLPPGTYTIEQTSGSGLVMVHRLGDGNAAAVMTIPVVAGPETDPGARFVTVAGQKYLDRVELTDGSVHAVIARSAK